MVVKEQDKVTQDSLGRQPLAQDKGSEQNMLLFFLQLFYRLLFFTSTALRVYEFR